VIQAMNHALVFSIWCYSSAMTFPLLQQHSRNTELHENCASHSGCVWHQAEPGMSALQLFVCFLCDDCDRLAPCIFAPYV